MRECADIVWYCQSCHGDPVGLTEAYREDCGTHGYIRQLLALPFLPTDKLKRRFKTLREQVSVRPLKELCTYIEGNWITSTTFPPASWSVYQEAVRTNNDLEGWHNGLNRHAKGRAQLPLYILIQLLSKEATLVTLQIRLVSDKKLKRRQRTAYKTMQKRLFKLWKQHKDGEKNSKELLEACSYLVKPLNI